MDLPTSDMIKDVYNELACIMEAPVGTPEMADIDRELTPILTELMTLGPYSENHPSVRQLLNWFLQPQCTVSEINYVIGPLGHHVYLVMCDHFYDYMYKRQFRYPIYLGQAAAEALAVKCPILKGPWEHTAWLVVRLLRYYDLGGLPSDHLTAWIIRMVGDSKICPNAYLRIELMFLFKMVQLDRHNSPQATEAVMSACSALSIEYLSGFWYMDFSILHFKPFFRIFKEVIEDGCLPMYGVILATYLNEANITRLSERVHDVSYRYGLCPIKYTVPRELKSLISLINTSAGYIRKEMKRHEAPYNSSSMISFVYDIFQTLIRNFKPCYKMPQLIQPTATLVLNVLEFVLKGYTLHVDVNDDIKLYVKDTDKLLQEILTEDGFIAIVNSPIGQELISRYGRRLRGIKDSCNDLDAFHTIFTLLKHS